MPTTPPANPDPSDTPGSRTDHRPSTSTPPTDRDAPDAPQPRNLRTGRRPSATTPGDPNTPASADRGVSYSTPAHQKSAASTPTDQETATFTPTDQRAATSAPADEDVAASAPAARADRQADPGLRYGSAPGRRAAILRRVSRDGYVSAADLVDELGVSPNTIRRDLQRLASDGLIRAVRGGATPADATALPFSDRSTQAAAAKRAIAAAAVRHIEPGTTVALDSGTTTLEIAKLLPADAGLTVVTHSLPAIAALAPRPDITLIGIGGQYSRDTRSFGGPETIAALEHLGVRTLFLAATALDEAGVYGATPYEAETKRRLISIARDTIVVSDARKFELSAPIRVCTWSAVTCLITDALPADLTLPVHTTLVP